MKKRGLMIVAALVVGAFAVPVVVLLTTPPSISATKTSFDRLTDDMTEADVYRTLGRAPDMNLLGMPDRIGVRWFAADGNATVLFKDGRIYHKCWSAEPPRETWAQAIRDLLGS